MGLLNAFRLKPITSIREEVIESLRNLFSTKKHYGAVPLELGLDDYSGTHFSTEVIQEIEEDIARNIKSYEKRITLKKVEVSTFKSYADFEVRIEGEIEGESVEIFAHITRKKQTNVTVRFF